MELDQFAETDEDVFFLMYNSFNELLEALRESSQLYVQELDDRTEQKEEISITIFVSSIIVLILSMIVLYPVVSSVNRQKDKVLSLFCDIDNINVRMLAQRCERFINQIQAQDNNEDIESNEGDDVMIKSDEDDEYGLLSGQGRKIRSA